MQKYSPFLRENSTSFAVLERGRHITSPKHLLQKSLGGHTSLSHFLHSLQVKLLFFNSCSNLFIALISIPLCVFFDILYASTADMIVDFIDERSSFLVNPAEIAFWPIPVIQTGWSQIFFM